MRQNAGQTLFRNISAQFGYMIAHLRQIVVLAQRNQSVWEFVFRHGNASIYNKTLRRAFYLIQFVVFILAYALNIK